MAHFCHKIQQILCIQRVTYKSFFILICTVFVIAMIFKNEINFTPSFRDSHFIKIFPNQHFQEKAIKRILIWQPHIGADLTERENTCLRQCSVRCTATNDKNNIANVDAVDFHLTNLWTEIWNIGTKSAIQFPAYRRPDQVWIVSNLEPPQHMWGDLKIFNGVFNWTRWYRLDATIKWRYGFPYKLNNKERKTSYEHIKDRNIYREKTKEIAARISNCITPNRRYKLVHDIQKYLKVDLFGLCYDKPCGKASDQWDKHCDTILRQYKFYLALENNDCKDYVTEKYWFALDRDQIPIVNWKSVNTNAVIPNSYINIYDFEDIKTLAEYIQKLTKNETLYNSYFDWKMKYANQNPCPSCDICQALHDRERPAQIVEDLDGWVRNDICQKVEYFSNFRNTLNSYKYKVFGL